MSAEALSMYKKLDKKNLQTKLAIQCAPVIAGIKVSNLVTVETGLVREAVRLFSGTGVRVFVFCHRGSSVSLLLYRKDALVEYLKQPDVCSMLTEFGVPVIDSTGSINLGMIFAHIAKKYKAHLDKDAQFPHELGLILGYPAEDVAGFMENNGQNFKLNGYWKVYGQEEPAREKFSRYDMAKEMAVRLLANNRSLLELMHGSI